MPVHSPNQVIDVLPPQVVPPTPEELARSIAEIGECRTILETAESDRSTENIAALLGVTSRLRKIRPSIETEGQFAILKGISLLLLNADRELPFAMEAVQYQIALARLLDLKPRLLFALNNLAAVASQLDNHVEALESCAAAREVAIAIDSPVGEMRAVQNGAACLINIGRYDEALAALRTALTIADRAGFDEAASPEWVILCNIAQCQLQLGSFEEGLQAAEAARDMAPDRDELVTHATRALVEFTILRLLFALGRHGEMRAAFDRQSAFTSKAASPGSRIDLSTARALIEVAAGNRQVGLSRLVATHEKANIITSTLPDVLASMVAAYRTSEQEEKAQRAEALLRNLLAGRQATARMRAGYLPERIGTAGQTQRVDEYDRRLDAAREKLLRAGDR